MKGWFDAFRHDGGPTLYDRANRTAVTGDVPTIVICVIFITLYAAFVIIFPGIRKQVSVAPSLRRPADGLPLLLDAVVKTWRQTFQSIFCGPGASSVALAGFRMAGTFRK